MTFFSKKEINLTALSNWKNWKFWVWFSSYTSFTPVELTSWDQAVG